MCTETLENHLIFYSLLKNSSALCRRAMVFFTSDQKGTESNDLHNNEIEKTKFFDSFLLCCVVHSDTVGSEKHQRHVSNSVPLHIQVIGKRYEKNILF